MRYSFKFHYWALDNTLHTLQKDWHCNCGMKDMIWILDHKRLALHFLQMTTVLQKHRDYPILMKQTIIKTIDKTNLLEKVQEWYRGRHSGTGGQGSDMQLSCIILHSSPCWHWNSSQGLGLHSQIGHPFGSSWSPNSHCREHLFCGHWAGSKISKPENQHGESTQENKKKELENILWQLASSEIGTLVPWISRPAESTHHRCFPKLWILKYSPISSHSGMKTRLAGIPLSLALFSKILFWCRHAVQWNMIGTIRRI